MRRYLSFLLLLFILSAVSASASPGRPAYVLRYTRDQSFLDVFDIDNDVIKETLLIPEESGYNNFVVDEQGGCYLAKYRTLFDYCRDIDYYDPVKKKIVNFIHFGDMFGPRYMILTPTQLIVEVRGNDDTRLNSGIVFIDRQSKKITGRVFLHENEPEYIQANINDLCYDGNRYLLLSSYYALRSSGPQRGEDAQGDIYVIDVKEHKLVKRIAVPREYYYVDGVYKHRDNVYVAAMGKGLDPVERSSLPNNELLVFSFQTGKLVKTIPVSGRPFKLVADESVNKLYVQHLDDYEPRATIEVIDLRTDRVSSKLTVPEQLMIAAVKPGKLYITAKKSVPTTWGLRDGLLVVDTATDRFVKSFLGIYKGISEKSFVD